MSKKFPHKWFQIHIGNYVKIGHLNQNGYIKFPKSVPKITKKRMGTNYLNDVCHPVYHVQYIVRYTVRYTVRPGMICAVGKSSARLTRSFFYAWQPSLFSLEDGKGLFGKRVSAMASFLVLAKMASHRAKTSPLYHNEPPTSIEPLRGRRKQQQPLHTSKE